DGIVSTPDVDAAASEKAAAELLEPAPDPEPTDDTDPEPEATETAAEEPEESADEVPDSHVVLGDDDDFWHKVGIDPVRLMTRSGTFYTLRCYLGDEPIFLGRNGRISVFPSERSLARYLADEHDHDLSDLATYDDIRTAATGGSLRVEVTEDNIYVLSGIADDIADGPDATDRDQLELAVELLQDVGIYSEDTTVKDTLEPDTALGRFIGHVLDPET